MDLALHLRVLSRHRVLLVAGLTLAVLLALLSFVRIGPDGVSYRQGEKWKSVTRLTVAQGGKPFAPATSAVSPTTFAILASQFSASDAVKRLVRKDGRIEGEVTTDTVWSEATGFLPFIDLAGIAGTPADAQALARRGAKALSTFVEQQQASSGVRRDRRMLLEVVTQSGAPTVAEGRSKATPMLILLAIASITFGGIYVLENVRGSRQHQAERPLGDLEPNEQPPGQHEVAHPPAERRPAPPVALPGRRPKRTAGDDAARPATLSIESPGNREPRSRSDNFARADEG
jgi:hypothetical protein